MFIAESWRSSRKCNKQCRGRGYVECMAYLAAVSAGSGVPLFIRTRGDVPQVSREWSINGTRMIVITWSFTPQLSFPVVAALNGAHFFTSNASCTLRSCCSGDVRTAWKCFSDWWAHCRMMMMIQSPINHTDPHPLTASLSLLWWPMTAHQTHSYSTCWN